MNRINTTKNKIKEYESHTLTSKWKNYFMIFILGLKIIIWNYWITFSTYLLVMFDFTFKYEENNDLVPNDSLFMFL